MLAGSQRLIIGDLRSLQVNDRTHAVGLQQAVQGGADMATRAMLSTMRAIIQAAERSKKS